jgi:hypothetical protein
LHADPLPRFRMGLCRPDADCDTEMEYYVKALTESSQEEGKIADTMLEASMEVDGGSAKALSNSAFFSQAAQREFKGSGQDTKCFLDKRAEA